MAVKRKAKLDAYNVTYGIGAAVLITGAMFKFLNMPYANVMLLVGLAVEAMVFLLSGFELQKEDVDYSWEKVFPQLTKDGETNIERLEELIEKANLDPLIVERLTNSIEKLEQNVSKMNQISDTTQLTEHLERMKKSSETFEKEISRLNNSIAEMNNYYMKMLDVMGNRKAGSTAPPPTK